uniref:Glycosyl transferase family 2 n=1 Tax=Cyanothece sp. (strain PCC 7425 / ATCC 29141) TaxID=395961 RepID=B8HXE5_CYAP4
MKIQSLTQRLLNLRLTKFLFAGGVAFLINVLILALLINYWQWNTPILRNLANIVSIEISLVFSFFIYRTWVWPGGSWSISEVILRQLPLYHFSGGMVILLRIFLIFPLLDWLKVNYAINTLIGVLIGAIINYVINDRLIFQKKSLDKINGKAIPDIYYPEGLELAVRPPVKTPVCANANTSLQLLSIIIPAYNEEECIAETIQGITQYLNAYEIDYEIVVINDNSRDHTEDILKALQQENPRIRYLNSYYPNGFGFAVRCGLENFCGDAAVIVMADGSDPPENILNYYYKLQEGYDCVFGSRFIKGGKVVDYPQHKLIINRLANLFVQVLFGLKLNDTTNAFKIYRREVIEGVQPLISHHFNLTVEIPLKAIVRGYSYAVVPIAWYNRKAGISKLKLKEMGSRYLFIVLYILLEKLLSQGDYVRRRSPKIRL